VQDRVFYDPGLAAGSSGKPLWEESLEGLIDELDYIKANCQRHMRTSRSRLVNFDSPVTY